ncbi:serine/threonine-protein kinase [Streptomyces sp. NPDC002825]|uniref:serine/threonine-protein kinase n=1 Tax=Streptomyces sp. NPDC002825 TaxID=3154666 RepID=UPI003325D358
MHRAVVSSGKHCRRLCTAATPGAGEALIGTGVDDILTPLGPDDPRDVAGYRLVARLGAGGMGTVYLSHTRGGQPVALKLILREYGQDPEFRQRFEQEVQAARRVQGYHLVPVVDHDTSGTSPWLASAFVPGIALHDALGAFGALPLTTVFPLVGCAARALTSIHAAGVVHRDLKPSNVMLAPTGPYVIDFGIARAADATQITRSGRIIGTPQYMSPEHALGEPVTPAGDVFSLGLIAAVAATGRHPYGDGGAFTVGTRIANTALRPPDLDGYPTELRPLLERCLAADPAVRITPAELTDWCERATGRPLTALGDWLPGPVAEAVDRRVRAAAQPATGDTPPPPPHEPTRPDTPPPPPHEPTRPDTPPPPPHEPTRPDTPPTGTPYAPTVDAPAPPPPPRFGPPTAAPAPAPAPSRRRQVRIALTVTAAVLAVAGAWGFAQSLGAGGDDENDARGGGRKPTPTASTTPSAKPSTIPSSGGDEGTLLFKDRPFALRAPADPGIAKADLDIPAVDSSAKFNTPEAELVMSEISGGRWEFPNGMGKSTGRTARECLEGARSNALPDKIDAKDLRTEIPVGTLLCGTTSDGRLALLEITRITRNAENDLPDYFAELTVWKP